MRVSLGPHELHMANSTATFFRFLSENVDLVLAIFERSELDEADLLALIDRHRTENQSAADHLRRQIEELGIVERAAHAESSLELSQPMVELLSWLTRRQRLSSAAVLRAYLDEVATTERELDQAIHARDASAAALHLKDLDGFVERVRALSDSNRDAIITEAQTLRATAHQSSSVDRFATVRRLWERYLEPLRQLVAVQGEMEQRLGRLRTLLEQGEQTFLAHGPVNRAFSRAVARLTRMRRVAAEDHLAAVIEIAPLYERLRRDSRWALGASFMLRRVLEDGAAAAGLDCRLGLTGWRPRFLMSDDQLRARLAGLVGYEPVGPVTIADAPPPAVAPIIAHDELRAALIAATPIADVLGLILARWPEHPVASQLRAFGVVAGGEMGPVTVDPATAARLYPVPFGSIEAWPLTLDAVTS